MMKTVFATVHILVVPLVFCLLGIPGTSVAQSDCESTIQTVPEDPENPNGRPLLEVLNQGEIAQGACMDVSIDSRLAGEGDFSIEIDQTHGSGFSFDTPDGPQSKTVGTEPFRICSNSSACGSAKIMRVVGNERKEIGSVRTTVGEWYEIEPSCPIPGPATHHVPPYLTWTRVSGAYKVYEAVDQPWFIVGWGCCDEVINSQCAPKRCSAICETDQKCHPVRGCMRCIRETESYHPNCQRDYVEFSHQVPDCDICEVDVQCFCVSEFHLHEFRCSP